MGWLELILYSADSALRSVMGMRPAFLLRRLRRDFNGRRDEGVSLVTKKGTSSDLVHARPAHLESRYAILEDSKRADAQFFDLRQKLFADSDALSAAARYGQGGKTVFRESGKTSDGRAFLFFKPLNDYGWLIERSGPGWRVSRAEKIINQDMFLRSNSDPWDVAILYIDPARPDLLRVTSQRFGQTLMTMLVYEQKMRQSFGVELLGNTH